MTSLLQWNISTLLLMAVLVSFMGFCLENAFLCIGRGYIDNRNMTLPFLIGYGLAIAGFALILGIPQKGDFLRYFVITCLAVSAGEITVGKTAEHLLGFFYWDYTNIPLHITRYTSVPTSIGFGALITLFMRYWFVPLMAIIAKTPFSNRYAAGLILTALLVLDFGYSFLIMYRRQAPNLRWRFQLFVM